MAETPAMNDPAVRVIGAGDTLGGRYRVLRTLGAGGMGVVLEALDTTLGVSVALKVMRHRDNLAIQRGRFLREARTVQELQHPNIIQVYGTGELDDGRLYIVSELLHGETLGQMLARRGTLPAEDVIYVAIEVLKALEVAHAAGRIHRDLKPDNIFLTRRGGIKVLDFGMVKQVVDEDSLGPLTRTGTVGGTPQYIAPEMAKGQEADARSDIYALGVIVFEACVGRPPFDAKNPVDVLLQHINAPVPDLDCPRNDVPESLAALIVRSLAKVRGERPESATVLRDALAQVAGHLPPTMLATHGDAVDSGTADGPTRGLGEDRSIGETIGMEVVEDLRDTRSSESIESSPVESSPVESSLVESSLVDGVEPHDSAALSVDVTEEALNEIDTLRELDSVGPTRVMQAIPMDDASTETFSGASSSPVEEDTPQKDVVKPEHAETGSSGLANDATPLRQAHRSGQRSFHCGVAALALFSFGAVLLYFWSQM